jgi:hypothetical protein
VVAGGKDCKKEDTNNNALKVAPTEAAKER